MGLAPLMAKTLGNKRILSLSGGADKLVPYRCGEPFLSWLKKAIGKGGWYEQGGVVFEDMVFDGVGHEVPHCYGEGACEICRREFGRERQR